MHSNNIAAHAVKSDSLLIHRDCRHLLFVLDCQRNSDVPTPLQIHVQIRDVVAT